jgi:hypothetical protein
MQPTLGFDSAGIQEASAACPGMNDDSKRVYQVAERRMRAYIVNNLADTCEKTRILQYRFTHRDAVSAELASISEKTGGMRQGTHGHGAIVGSHPAKVVLRDQGRTGSELGGAERRSRARWSCADDAYVHTASNSSQPSESNRSGDLG